MTRVGSQRHRKKKLIYGQIELYNSHSERLIKVQFFGRCAFPSDKELTTFRRRFLSERLLKVQSVLEVALFL